MLILSMRMENAYYVVSRSVQSIMYSQCRYAWWLITIQIYARLYYYFNNIIHNSLPLIIFHACIVLLLHVPVI